MNNMIIFSNKEFGEIRTITIDNEVWFVGKDIASALGYTNPQKALKDHVENDDKKMGEQNVTPSIIDNLGRKQYPTFINESGLYSLTFNSKLPTAKKFKHWVTSEVLPSIRKTGGYLIKQEVTDFQKKELEVREKEVNLSIAKLWIQLGDRTLIPEYKQIADSYASEILAGKKVLPLPEAQEKTYSANEIGKMLGVSACKIGRLANKYNLKTTEYGKLFYDKSRYSNKEVETFRYFNNAISKFKELLA